MCVIKVKCPAFIHYNNWLVAGVSADCDSGYEASTMDTVTTSSYITSPCTDTMNMQVNFCASSENLQQGSGDIFNLDTSQDSIEPEDDNASTVSNLSDLSGLSELSGQDWKPMAGSMAWVCFSVS